jgi:hypothetical protein
MFTQEELTRARTLERNVTILEQSAPAAAGGLSASVINGKVQVTAWIPEQEITVVLSLRELHALRYFLNATVEAALNGTDYPAAFIGDRNMIERTAIGRLELDTRAVTAGGGFRAFGHRHPVDRGGYREILDLSPAAVDLTARKRAWHCCCTTTKPDRLAVSRTIRTDGHHLRGTARFSSSPEAQQARADVEAGILPRFPLAIAFWRQPTKQTVMSALRAGPRWNLPGCHSG